MLRCSAPQENGSLLPWHLFNDQPCSMNQLKTSCPAAYPFLFFGKPLGFRFLFYADSHSAFLSTSHSSHAPEIFHWNSCVSKGTWESHSETLQLKPILWGRNGNPKPSGGCLLEFRGIQSVSKNSYECGVFEIYRDLLDRGCGVLKTFSILQWLWMMRIHWDFMIVDEKYSRISMSMYYFPKTCVKVIGKCETADITYI